MAKEKNKTELPKVMEGELTARLVKLREDAGYDVSQMADALCLSEEVIVNLENEAFDLLAEPPYVRGYLRNYAKLGDEDASELINRYESLRGADAAELNFQVKSSAAINATTKKRLSPIWSQVIMLGVLVGAIALISSIPGVKTWVSDKWESLSSKLEPSSAENNPSLLGQLPVPSPLPGDQENNSAQNTNNATNQNSQTTAEALANNTQSTQNDATNTQSNQAINNSNSEPTNTSENTETSTENNNTNNETTETPAATETSTNEQVTTQPETTENAVPSDPNGMINIKLVFDKEVWLRIKDKDNKTVFEGLNKAGTEKTIDLMKPLTFRVGNAQGLSLFIDNKAVDISTYINGSIANFTLE